MIDALVWGRDDARDFAMIGTERLTLELAVDLMRRCLAKYEEDATGPGPDDPIN